MKQTGLLPTRRILSVLSQATSGRERKVAEAVTHKRTGLASSRQLPTSNEGVSCDIGTSSGKSDGISFLCSEDFALDHPILSPCDG